MPSLQHLPVDGHKLVIGDFENSPGHVIFGDRLQNDVASTPALVLSTCGVVPIVFALGRDATFNFHDASGVSFLASGATAGHANFWQTEDGGVGGSGGNAGAGGLLQILTGDGGAGLATCNRTGGIGGALTIQTGAGGADPACSSGATGAGGALSITGGAGGAVVGTGAPAIGGVVHITAGTGGATGVACDVAGAGAELILQAGPGGAGTAACSCTGGAGGSLTLRTGTVGCGASNGAIGRLRFLDGAGTALFSAAAGSEPSALLGTVWAYQGGACAVAPAGSAFLVIVDDGSV